MTATRTAGLVLALASTLPVRAAALWTSWTEFFHRQLAVAVFVQRAECSRCVVDFIGVDDTVMIGVERRNQGRRLHLTATGTAGATGRALAIGVLSAILSGEGECRASDGESGNDSCAITFHTGSFPWIAASDWLHQM